MKEKLNTCAPSAGECGGSFEFGARDLIGQRIFWGAELTRWVLLHPRFCPLRHIWQIFAGGENRKKLIKNQIQGLERWDKNHSVEEVCAHILVPKAMFWGMGKTQNFATNKYYFRGYCRIHFPETRWPQASENEQSKLEGKTKPKINKIKKQGGVCEFWVAPCPLLGLNPVIDKGLL